MIRKLLFFVSLFIFSAQAIAQTAPKGGVLAEVDGEAITSDQVAKSLGEPLARLEEQVYRMKQKKLDQLIDERLLAREAAKRGVSVEQLLDIEVTKKAENVSPEEVDTFYQGNKAHFSGDEAAARNQIESFLQNQKAAARRKAFLQSLKSSAAIEIYLQPPQPFRADVSVAGAFFRGPSTAPVTIVEFQDFQCPFCKRVQPTLTQIQSRYGDKVKLVYRDFPLESLHPDALRAHEAARCAGEQNKFWEYHDVLFATAPAASPEQLDAYAKQVGIDVPKFKSCLSSGKYLGAIQKDEEEGARLGVSGTPSFFINGRPLPGAQSLEEFDRIIDEELAAQVKGTASNAAH